MWFCSVWSVGFLLLSVFGLVYVFNFYRRFRTRRSNVRVTCWFCGADCVVPFGNKNCWDCPSCEQYNGFDEDGGYNKPIPSQYDNLLNHSTHCISNKSEAVEAVNGLCDSCNRNQLLKVKQLAAFVPQHDSQYDEEVEAYERYLESVYKLCPTCEAVVHKTLSHQDVLLRSDVLSWRLHSKRKDHASPTRKSQAVVSKTLGFHVAALRLVSLAISAWICLQTVYVLQLRTRKELFPLERVIPQKLLSHFVGTQEYGLACCVVGLFGLIGGVFMAGKDKLKAVDALSCCIWLLTLFIHLPIFSPLFPTPEEQLILRGLLSFLGVVSTSCCILWKRSPPKVWENSSFSSMNGSYSSISSASSCSPRSPSSVIFDHNSLSKGDGNKVLNSDLTALRVHAGLMPGLVQDSHISTTTKYSKAVVAMMPSPLPSTGKTFDLDSNLQAMKISSPRKNHQMPGIFTKRSYSATNLSPPLLDFPLRGNTFSRCPVLSPARFKSRSITQSSWVAGGYWSTPSPSARLRNSFGSQSDLFLDSGVGSNRNVFDHLTKTSYSCQASRAGSVSCDDKLSVFSEPPVACRNMSPFAFASPSPNTSLRGSLSPFRDEAPSDCCSDSSDSSHNSTISRGSRDATVLTKHEAGISGQHTVNEASGIRRRKGFLLFLGISLMANAFFAVFIILWYFT